MQITNFSFDDQKNNWHLEETSFDNPLNLLVGISGVGKTKILKALRLVRNVATSQEDYTLDGIEWKISFVHQDQKYEWRLKSASIPESEKSLEALPSKPTQITYESVVNVSKQTAIFERSENSLKWGGQTVIPTVNKAKSVITLFSEDDSMVPIREALGSIIFIESVQDSVLIVNRLEDIKLKDERNNSLPLKEFRKKFVQSPMLVKAFFLQKFFAVDFERLKQDFIDIFPFVNDIKIDYIQRVREYKIFFGVQEAHGRNSTEWIYQEQVSSGMFRVFSQLVEIYLAPEGAVIVIDEFENSLGTNCMPGATDFISRQPHLQFILTSHHPYIIDNLSWKTWKLVSRKDCRVKVVNATDISQLQTDSSLDRFIQLINVPEYQKGIL